jgi:hypothetical protein
MLSLSEYAVVGRDATMYEALGALDRAQALRDPNLQPHRAVLVREADGSIVGKMGHLAFLRALLPERRTWKSDIAMLERAGVSEDMTDSSDHIFEMLDEEVDIAERAKNVRVIDVCTPTTAFIERDATLLETIRVFLAHQTSSLLVTEGKRTVGIVRLPDLFDEMAKILRKDMQQGG